MTRIVRWRALERWTLRPVGKVHRVARRKGGRIASARGPVA